MKSLRSLGIGAALVFAAWCATAQADIVYLDDGRKFEGVVTDEGDHYKVVTKMGPLTFGKDKVTRVEKVKSAEEVYKEKAGAVKEGDAEGHYELALWCREAKLTREMNIELEKTIAINPNHEAARSALNYVKIDGHWVKAKPGMVWVSGEWIKPEEALEKGKALYKVEKYEDAYKAFDGAAKGLKKECDFADAELNLGLAAERLGRWGDAKAAYDAVLLMKLNVDQKSVAEAHKSVINSCAGGMYLVKEPTGRDDIFSLNNEAKAKQKALVGLQSLSNPDVMNIALREKCMVFIERGKDLLKQAKDSNTGAADSDRKTLGLLDQAEEQFQMADRTVKDLARGFLVECTKIRVDVVARPFNTRWAQVRGAIARIDTVANPDQKIKTAKDILSQLDDLSKSLDAIQQLTGKYPDELSQEVASGKNIRATITNLKAQLTGFVGGK